MVVISLPQFFGRLLIAGGLPLLCWYSLFIAETQSSRRFFNFSVLRGIVEFALVSRCSSIGLKGQSPLKRVQGALAPFVLLAWTFTSRPSGDSPTNPRRTNFSRRSQRLCGEKVSQYTHQHDWGRPPIGFLPSTEAGFRARGGGRCQSPTVSEP